MIGFIEPLYWLATFALSLWFARRHDSPPARAGRQTAASHPPSAMLARAGPFSWGRWTVSFH